MRYVICDKNTFLLMTGTYTYVWSWARATIFKNKRKAQQIASRAGGQVVTLEDKKS